MRILVDVMSGDNAPLEMLKGVSLAAQEYKEHERHQWYLTAKEMKEKGLIDIIIGEDDIYENGKE